MSFLAARSALVIGPGYIVSRFGGHVSKWIRAIFSVKTEKASFKRTIV